jgi:hypothetical protein
MFLETWTIPNKQFPDDKFSFDLSFVRSKYIAYTTYVCLIFKQNKFNIGDAAFYSSIDTEMLKILVYGWCVEF